MDDKIATSAEAAEDEVLPCLYEVHCNPDGSIERSEKTPTAVSKTPSAQKSPAQWAYERVVLYLKKFEEQLDSDHEAAIGFTGADAGVLRIEGMGYFDPDVVTFYGSDPAGGRTQLIQHVSQLNVILRALPKAVDHAVPNRIGFRLVEELEAEEKR
ncbi:DUF6173 family protein [Sulfitobacter aestuariivivens]|uniref:Uncharacterized protein n=1 Tax=Sulfitobacter aestuariivivens TaxID=2766981 RepID=A0A927HE60_9RHOB|nr:DUF6173 family protein [Sulfitobacter aestuariivivens]MBD3664432.1 hypothetical protein [Sulfitobacter aestuariivivens]